jgi:hypothetical protein
MNLFRLISGNKGNTRNSKSPNAEKSINNSKTLDNLLTCTEEFINFESESNFNNAYFINAWVNIAVNILMRNIARADFTIKNQQPRSMLLGM